MRQRRHKRVRKAVRFYKVCFQFREPFKARARVLRQRHAESACLTHTADACMHTRRSCSTATSCMRAKR
jgi:hypothetical protein